MEVIHSPGARSFNQPGRSGAVGNFLTFNSLGEEFPSPTLRINKGALYDVVRLILPPLDEERVHYYAVVNWLIRNLPRSGLLEQISAADGFQPSLTSVVMHEKCNVHV